MGILDWSGKGQKSMHQTSNFGESTLKSNGLNENEGVINYTQRIASRQASIENVIRFTLSPAFRLAQLSLQIVDTVRHSD